jgi:hypothetical protein
MPKRSRSQEARKKQRQRSKWPAEKAQKRLQKKRCYDKKKRKEKDLQKKLQRMAEREQQRQKKEEALKKKLQRKKEAVVRRQSCKGPTEFHFGMRSAKTALPPMKIPRAAEVRLCSDLTKQN